MELLSSNALSNISLAASKPKIEPLVNPLKNLTPTVRTDINLESKQFSCKSVGKENFWGEFYTRCNASKDSCRRLGDQNLDGTRETLCSQCRLPLGDFAYPDGSGALIHGECMARQMRQELEDEEECQKRQNEKVKMIRRSEYGIGWKMDKIPRNFDLQLRLKDVIRSHGMSCLVFDESSKSVRLAPTLEPSAAVNLEYLSVALQVRRKDGREPLFSLDPVPQENVHDDRFSKHSSQFKRFEPDWLAGTTVGEILFQADYYLKELSMGESDQPVIGMKSVLDLCNDSDSRKWSAREWLMVRNAEVYLSEDDVLIPHVKMGVEARELVQTENGLQDAPITRKDHPMVKYADSFSKNFDLIAERKSVVYHLRELAKASVLAKFLIDADVVVEESWFELAGEVEEACSLEIPQLWNERTHSTICVKDGELMGAGTGIQSQVCGIYGGVNFALDQFDISRIAPRRTFKLTRPDVAIFSPMVVPLAPSSIALTPSSGTLFSLAKPLMPQPRGRAPALQAALAGDTREKPPKGVDLNLNQFCLDAHDVEGKCISEPQSKEACAERLEVFWASVHGGAHSEHGHLFRDVFNPSLSDRHAEGGCFSPPDTSSAYMSKLDALVKQEDEIREQRKGHFFSVDFEEEAPSALFPSSWGSSTAIENSKAKRGGNLQARNDYVAKSRQIMEAGPPVFHKQTEDGIAWRIYRLGSLEVRTIQESKAEEVVGAMFSVRSSACMKSTRSVSGREVIVKVTEYVEMMQKPTSKSHKGGYQYYVTFETDDGNIIASEQIGERATWEENGVDLVDRNSLARVVRTARCRQAQISVEMLKSSRDASLDQRVNLADHYRSRSYATNLFVAALGGMTEAVQAIENYRVEMETSSVADDGRENKFDAQFIISDAELSPCTQCGQSFTSGFKDAGDRWYCSKCWMREQYVMPVNWYPEIDGIVQNVG